MNIGYVLTVEQWMWELDLYQSYSKYVRNHNGMYDSYEQNPADAPYDMFTFLVTRAYMDDFRDGLIALGVPKQDIRTYPIGRELE